MHGKDSAKAIQRRLKNQRSSDFFKLAESYLKDLEDRKRLYAIKNTNVMLNKLEQFEGERSLSVKDVDTNYLEKFEGFLKKRYNNRPTTINKNFEPIIEIVRKALNDHLITIDPFQNFKGAKRGKAEPKVKLTIDQIRAIEKVDLDFESNLWHTRNFFMFSFYSAGIRFGDLCCLKWSNIKGNRISYQMNKNEKVFAVELNDHQLRILNHYEVEDNSGFIFPILNNNKDYTDPIYLRQQIGSKNALINKWLKRLIKKVNMMIELDDIGIPKLDDISFHVARHSFAQYAVEEKGLSIYEVMQTLRYSKIETTQNYLKGLNEELADKAMKKVF